MARSSHLTMLRSVRELRTCPPHALTELARIVDVVDLPAGAPLRARPGDLVMTLAPTRLLVIDRRAVPRSVELAPELAWAIDPRGVTDPSRSSPRHAAPGAGTSPDTRGAAARRHG